MKNYFSFTAVLFFLLSACKQNHNNGIHDFRDTFLGTYKTTISFRTVGPGKIDTVMLNGDTTIIQRVYDTTTYNNDTIVYILVQKAASDDSSVIVFNQTLRINPYPYDLHSHSTDTITFGLRGSDTSYYVHFFRDSIIINHKYGMGLNITFTDGWTGKKQ